MTDCVTPVNVETGEYFAPARDDLFQKVAHAMKMIGVRMGLDDDLEGPDMMDSAEFREPIPHIVRSWQKTIHEDPSIPREADDDGIPVAAVEQEYLNVGRISRA